MAYTEIDNPELYFQVKTYSGDSSGQAITLDGEEDMAPNLVWLKRRNGSAGHKLNDTVRGVNKQLVSNNSNAEGTDTNQLTAFGSNGFTVSNNTDVSTDGGTYVAWCWKESATAGFDIVAYTGTGSAHTESHSLSAVPHLMIFKNRTSSSTNWLVYHHKTSTSPEDDYLTLETTDAVGATASFLDDTAPTSSVFTVGANNNANESSSAQITYLWTAKQGFSKFGSYTGNGNADGTFIYTGFRPAYVMVKETGNVNSWRVVDNKRSTFNVMNKTLYANDSAVEATSAHEIDFLSNGFKQRSSDTNMNRSSGTFIYMAFAEAPFVNSNGVPCNAR